MRSRSKPSMELSGSPSEPIEGDVGFIVTATSVTGDTFTIVTYWNGTGPNAQALSRSPGRENREAAAKSGRGKRDEPRRRHVLSVSDEVRRRR